MTGRPSQSGFEPRTRDPERRDFFDLRRRLATLESGDLSGGAAPGAADEVFIGPNDPNDPKYELWYDTDAVPPFDAVKMPRGFVAYIISNFGGTLPANVNTNMGGAQNVTLLNGRRYRITVWWPANRGGGQSQIGVNGVGNYWWTIGSGWDSNTYVMYVAGDGGTRSVYVTITPAVACDHSGSFVLVEDIGGV